ncbi:MAG TPA: Gfo/Idh/MocA family oxidoreductase, partial [Spirochaetia bacterium]|nr:Gfo/Idh/MocA family oxidoreductase [Spirochaetia bacterium]
MSDKVRIGMIGAGFIGRTHLTMFSKVEQAELVGIYDAVPELAERVAHQFGLPKVFRSVEEMLGSREVDAVIIGVPNLYHKPLAVQALDSGKHVLLEKPMAVSGEAAREIYDTWKSGDRILMIGHQMRWEPLSQQARSVVASGELGGIYNVKAGMLRRVGIPGWGSWFTRKEQSGGGPLIDIGVHMLDLALWIMGNPRPSKVFGSTFSEFGPEKKGIGQWGTPQWDGRFDVEDYATALVKFDDGRTLSLDVSWAVNTDSDNGHYVHAMGNEGGLSLYAKRLVLTGQKFGRPFDIQIPAPEPPEHPRVLLSRHFVECVQTGKQPISDPASGLTNSMILDAIYRSSAAGAS